MATRIPTRLTAAEGRRFAFTVGGAFGVLACIALWRGRSATVAVLVSAAALLLLSGLFIPDRLGPVQRAWMGFAALISKVTTPVFMGVVYFVVLTPVGLVKRMAGGGIAPRAGAKSYWVARPDGARRGQLERQF